MPKLLEVLAHCQAQPAPVLFLDTCALLDLIRYVHRTTLEAPSVEAARQFLGQNRASPPGLHLVVHELVPAEWGKHVAQTVKEAETLVIRVEEVVGRLNAAGKMLSPGYQASSFLAGEGQAVVGQLRTLGEQLLAAAWLLEGEAAVEGAAFRRALARQAPASERKQELGDCTIIEHYLALCARLPPACSPRVFLSSNKNDYGAEAGGGLRPPLEAEFARVDLRWARNFAEAMHRLKGETG